MNPFTNGTIGAVYVIHARKFTERAAHMKEQLARFGIPFEFIEPYDADMLDAEVQSRFLAPTNRLTSGQNSCTLKHFEALRRIAAKNHSLALVLEDDVVLAKNFTGELARLVAEAKKLPPPYTIQIGCANNMYVPRSSLISGQLLYEAVEVRATDAYLIGAEAARSRLDWLEHNKIHMTTDHLCTFIDRQKNIRIYWSHPTLVEQGSMNGLFASTLLGKSKVKPLWQSKASFWWQRLRKKYIYQLFR